MRVWRALSNEPKIKLIGKKLQKWRRENDFATKMILWRHRVKSGTRNKYQLSSFFMLFHMGTKKVWARIWPTTRHFHPSSQFTIIGRSCSDYQIFTTWHTLEIDNSSQSVKSGKCELLFEFYEMHFLVTHGLKLSEEVSSDSRTLLWIFKTY